MTAGAVLRTTRDKTGMDVDAARRAAAGFLAALVAGHGRIPADSVRGRYAEARQVLSQLAALGIDYDEVTTRLEEHGLEMFDTSWRELSDQLATALRGPRENQESRS